MNEEEILEEEQDAQEPVTTTTTLSQESPTTTTQMITSDYSIGFPNNSDNVIHQLFGTLGVNLDYVPRNDYQATTMFFQLICALWFISWFCKFLWYYKLTSQYFQLNI